MSAWWIIPIVLCCVGTVLYSFWILGLVGKSSKKRINSMENEPLERYVKQIQSLDTQRKETAHAAFESLSKTDRELWELAIDVFGSNEKAALWLTEVPALDDKMPLELLMQGQREAVINCLQQIRHGMYS